MSTKATAGQPSVRTSRYARRHVPGTGGGGQSGDRQVESSLRLNGYDVLWVTTAREALTEAKAALFDLVLLDLGLPDMDGVDVCRRLRTGMPQAVPRRPSWATAVASAPMATTSATDRSHRDRPKRSSRTCPPPHRRSGHAASRRAFQRSGNSA
jgi:CheY-like chemotaxis protein